MYNGDVLISQIPRDQDHQISGQQNHIHHGIQIRSLEAIAVTATMIVISIHIFVVLPNMVMAMTTIFITVAKLLMMMVIIKMMIR